MPFHLLLSPKAAETSNLYVVIVNFSLLVSGNIALAKNHDKAFVLIDLIRIILLANSTVCTGGF